MCGKSFDSPRRPQTVVCFIVRTYNDNLESRRHFLEMSKINRFIVNKYCHFTFSDLHIFHCQPNLKFPSLERDWMSFSVVGWDLVKRYICWIYGNGKKSKVLWYGFFFFNAVTAVADNNPICSCNSFGQCSEFINLYEGFGFKSNKTLQ